MIGEVQAFEQPACEGLDNAFGMQAAEKSAAQMRGQSSMLDSAKISAAVTDCLQKCYGSPTPLGELAGHLSELERGPDWSQYEIEAVEMRVLRVLSRLVCESDHEQAV
jgi:hypothetical protein